MLYKLQLTWIPNEIAGYDLVLFEFLDRLMEPRSKLNQSAHLTLPSLPLHRLATKAMGVCQEQGCGGVLSQ